MRPRPHPLACALAVLLCACSPAPEADPPRSSTTAGEPSCPIPGGKLADERIIAGEKHFAHLWQLSFDGQNAEAYWNPAGTRLCLQRRWGDIECDRIFVTEASGDFRQISSGRGTTTCSYFLPDGKKVLYASTQAAHEDCPPKPDMSRGYCWAIYPEFDIYVQDLQTGAEELLVGGPGYDAEATVSPKGDLVVFTSTRSGDVELWTSAIDGSDVRQVTREIGYDGGAFFSHDGEWLVFRTTAFPGEDLEAEHAAFQELLDANLVKPGSMEVMVIRPDGTDRRQITHLGRANWAPYFYPSDERIIFCSNHHDPSRMGREFDLFAIDLDGTKLEQITFHEDFDSFPMFSPDGRYLVFASNRGGVEPGDTNLFIAEWR